MAETGLLEYDPSDEIGLIGHWQAIDDEKMDPKRVAFMRGSPDEPIAEEEAFAKYADLKRVKDAPPAEKTREEKVQFMRVPVAGFVGHEIDALEYSPEDQAVERQKNSVFEDTSELAHAGGSLIPGSLRENALTRVWYKLDLQRIGHIDNLMTASGNSLVVLQNHKNHVADLTTYEHGLIDYGLHRLREIIDREGGLPKHKFIAVCRSCLSGSTEMLEYLEKSEAQVYKYEKRPGGDAPSTPAQSKNRFGAASPTTAGSTTPMPMRKNSKMSSSSGRFHAEVDDFVTAQSALKLMLHRIFDKLDYKQQGYLDATPDPAQESLSSFESALIELAQFRLQYELKAGGVLERTQVTEILKETMDQDYPIEDDEPVDHTAVASPKKNNRKAQRGYPPLETAMRSVYREARKFRSEKTELTSQERERLECTFHPLINSNPPGPQHATSVARSRYPIFAGSGMRSMSTKDMKEYVELQECTFTPNLYKHLSNSKTRIHKTMYDFDPEHPQYRTKRRDANILVKELQKREHLEGHAEGALHMHGCRGKNYWEETLRQDNAESQFTTNERADPEERVKPDAGMDLGVRRERHNWNPTMAEPRDWGKYIRVNDVRYGAVIDKRTGGMDRADDIGAMTVDPEEAETAAKVFAETFLTMRQSRAHLRSRGIFN